MLAFPRQPSSTAGVCYKWPCVAISSRGRSSCNVQLLGSSRHCHKNVLQVSQGSWLIHGDTVLSNEVCAEAPWGKVNSSWVFWELTYQKLNHGQGVERTYGEKNAIHVCNMPHTETYRSALINLWKKPCKLSACRAKLAVIKARVIFSLQEIAP